MKISIKKGKTGNKKIYHIDKNILNENNINKINIQNNLPNLSQKTLPNNSQDNNLKILQNLQKESSEENEIENMLLNEFLNEEVILNELLNNEEKILNKNNVNIFIDKNYYDNYKDIFNYEKIIKIEGNTKWNDLYKILQIIMKKLKILFLSFKHNECTFKKIEFRTSKIMLKVWNNDSILILFNSNENTNNNNEPNLIREIEEVLLDDVDLFSSEVNYRGDELL
ncbi:hypothetical protein ABK040_013361 [Willaertia magna]